ncbi:unnamed protein product, partial [Allacma fusca]
MSDGRKLYRHTKKDYTNYYCIRNSESRGNQQ